MNSLGYNRGMHDSLSIGKKVLIMISMYNNGKKTTFKTQKLYENRESFRKAMKQLVKAKFINVGSVNRENEYKLTLNGILCIEEVLRNIA